MCSLHALNQVKKLRSAGQGVERHGAVEVIEDDVDIPVHVELRVLRHELIREDLALGLDTL